MQRRYQSLQSWYYSTMNAGKMELDMDEMKKDLWEYGGVRLEEREAE